MGEEASAVFAGRRSNGSLSRIVQQRVYRVGAARAATAMAQIRASTTCRTWRIRGGLVLATVTPGDRVVPGGR